MASKDCESKLSRARDMKQHEKIGQRILPAVTKDMLKEMEQIYQQQGDLTDNTLLALHSFFGSPFEKALELLETNCVVYLRAPKGRYMIQVTGSSGELYTLFPRVNYCPCQAYQYQVIVSQTFVTCKHVLAAHLAELLGKGRDFSVTDMELTRILCAAANLEEECQKILP